MPKPTSCDTDLAEPEPAEAEADTEAEVAVVCLPVALEKPSVGWRTVDDGEKEPLRGFSLEVLPAALANVSRPGPGPGLELLFECGECV